MTAPKVHTIKRGGSRFYVDPFSKEKVPGVTSILNMLPKPLLKPWGERTVAEFAADNIGTIVDMMVKGQRKEAVDYVKRAPYRETSGAAEIGDEVHKLAEKMILGEAVGRFHPDLSGYVDGFRDFMDAFQPTLLHSEVTIWSDTHGYAGSTDAIVEIAGETIIMDFKTTRSGIHEEVALQLTAYSRGDVIIDADGERRPMPEIAGAAALWLRPDKWHLRPVQISDALFDVFIALKVIFDWEREIKSGVLGRPVLSLDDLMKKAA